MSAFELSRIHGQGWTTARKLLASAKGDVDRREANVRNPHRTAETRARWTQGFMEALRSRTGVLAKPGGHVWRRAAVKKIPGGARTRP